MDALTLIVSIVALGVAAVALGVSLRRTRG